MDQQCASRPFAGIHGGGQTPAGTSKQIPGSQWPHRQRLPGQGRKAVSGDGPPMGPGATGTGAGGRIDFEADGPSDIGLKNRIPVSLKQHLLFGKIHLRAVKGCKLGVFVNQYRSFLKSGRPNPGIGQGQSLRFIPYVDLWHVL